MDFLDSELPSILFSILFAFTGWVSLIHQYAPRLTSPVGRRAFSISHGGTSQPSLCTCMRPTRLLLLYLLLIPLSLLPGSHIMLSCPHFSGSVQEGGTFRIPQALWKASRKD